MLENLLQQREELQTKISELNDLAATDTEKILQAIKNQRWYFFKNNKYILFDKDTALIWANLDYFPYENEYSCEKSYAEVKDLMKQKNSESWGGFNDWKIPTTFELKKLFEDKPFPFLIYDKGYSRGWRIKNLFGFWCVNRGDDELMGTSLDKGGDFGYFSNRCDVHILPCNHALMSEDYESNISSSNHVYTETEKLQFTLDIFVQNDLIPIFSNAEITQLYKKIFVEKPALVKQLAYLDAQIAELETSQLKLTANFDYEPILAGYDTAAIDKSPIKYFDAVIKLTDELLGILQEYETAQTETISEFSQIVLKLNAKYTDNPKLTPQENSLLAERQKFLAQRLELDTDEPKRKILSVKAQAQNFFERLDKINCGNDSIRELAALQAEPRADFELLVENLARIIRDAQRKVDFFTEHKDFVANIVNTWTAWNENYKALKTNLREELAAGCREDGVDDEIFAAWYEDWQKKRFAIEQRFLPLVEFALKGNLLNATEQVLKILQGYRDAVDKFYLQERKNIYQKFAFQAGGDLQEKFETESALYKLAEKLQRDLQDIIFSRDKTEERIFLLRWAEPLLNISIDEISNFIRDRELDAISEEILTQFAALRRQNFATYLADSKAYSEAVQKREKEFNALIFRMRKVARHSNNTKKN